MEMSGFILLRGTEQCHPSVSKGIAPLFRAGGIKAVPFPGFSPIASPALRELIIANFKNNMQCQIQEDHF
jgi:hypothetical protein